MKFKLISIFFFFAFRFTFLNEVSNLTLTNPSLFLRTCLRRKASCSRFSSDR